MNLICPDCRQPVEILKACGCRDYFCNHCNQIVSKRKVVDLDAEENAELSPPPNHEQPEQSAVGAGK